MNIILYENNLSIIIKSEIFSKVKIKCQTYL